MLHAIMIYVGFFSCLTPFPVSVLFQKFLFFVLKSSDVLDILVPILYYLNDARADQCKYSVHV